MIREIGSWLLQPNKKYYDPPDTAASCSFTLSWFLIIITYDNDVINREHDQTGACSRNAQAGLIVGPSVGPKALATKLVLQ